MAYPGDNVADNQGYARCLSSFRAYDGIDISLSAFSFTYVVPEPADDWASGDRQLVCVAYESTARYPGGAPVNYSINGSHT
jgi:hypothetical protein